MENLMTSWEIKDHFRLKLLAKTNVLHQCIPLAGAQT